MVLTNDYKPATAWLELGEDFYDIVAPASFPSHKLRWRNQEKAQALGLGRLNDEEWVNHFGKFAPLPSNLPHPLALRYHGHQFTHYNPDLGDGRGFLYGQVYDSLSQKLLDFGTKGSGQTPYSRQGDGRLTLKGAVREALATAYLEYHHVNTSKTFSIIETGESLVRSDEPSPTRAGVLVRLSHSHIRIGTFQRLAFLQDSKNIEKLIAYSCKHYYPDVGRDGFFGAVAKNIAKTTAQWMIHGFVHGVLNTDNINITGESFDYGPYRFLPHYDPQFTAAYFDHGSLYAYGRQPQMVFWNLERLRDALQLVIQDDAVFAQGFVDYQETFEQEVMRLFCQKLGVRPSADPQKVKNLFYQVLQFLEKSKAPYEAFFNDLYCWHQDLQRPLKDYNPLYDNDTMDDISKELVQLDRDPSAPEKKVGDLQTLLIDEIEAIWAAIDKRDDWSDFYQKLDALKSKK